MTPRDEFERLLPEMNGRVCVVVAGFSDPYLVRMEQFRTEERGVRGVVSWADPAPPPEKWSDRFFATWELLFVNPRYWNEPWVGWRDGAAQRIERPATPSRQRERARSRGASRRRRSRSRACPFGCSCRRHGPSEGRQAPQGPGPPLPFGEPLSPAGSFCHHSTEGKRSLGRAGAIGPGQATNAPAWSSRRTSTLWCGGCAVSGHEPLSFRPSCSPEQQFTQLGRFGKEPLALARKLL
jgi:hypothetical protein